MAARGERERREEGASEQVDRVRQGLGVLLCSSSQQGRGAQREGAAELEQLARSLQGEDDRPDISGSNPGYFRAGRKSPAKYPANRGSTPVPNFARDLAENSYPGYFRSTPGIFRPRNFRSAPGTFRPRQKWRTSSTKLV